MRNWRCSVACVNWMMSSAGTGRIRPGVMDETLAGRPRLRP